MQIYVAFGLPGSGKTFIGKIFKKHFGYHFYDGDHDLPDEMKQAIQNHAKVTNIMRGTFFRAIIKSVKKLETKYDKIIIAQTFIKEKYRNEFLYEFPKAKFILIQTDIATQEARLAQRGSDPLHLEYLRKMCSNFDKPRVNYQIINNNIEGEEKVEEQIQRILNVK